MFNFAKKKDLAELEDKVKRLEVMIKDHITLTATKPTVSHKVQYMTPEREKQIMKEAENQP